jgi:3-dehydroquinate dehydratase-2
MRKVMILNGPNLNMLGTREPEVYGSETLKDIQALCDQAATPLLIKLDFRQSNHEGELVSAIQEAGSHADGLIINPAGFGHTSVALLDALLSIKIPAIEVHLSNIYKREEFRHHTYTARAVRAVISGLGSFGYRLAIEALADIFKKNA